MWRWILGFVLTAALSGSTPLLAEEFRVCSVTINSSDEIETFRRYLPEPTFDFIELTAWAPVAAANGDGSWFTRACHSGTKCDVLVVSGHFGNTYAGSYGTTFQGESGVQLSLEELEARSCDGTCNDILARPLEVFLFGCRTLAGSLDDKPLKGKDAAVLAKYAVPPGTAERMIEEVKYRGEDTDNRNRMGFAFAGVPNLYGFSDVGPSGERVQPLLERYFRETKDYAAHLRRLAADGKRTPQPNAALAAAIHPSSFVQSTSLTPVDPAYERARRLCFLKNAANPVVARLRHVESLLDEQGFVAYLPAIEAFLRQHPADAFGPEERAAFERIQHHQRAAGVLRHLVDELKTPILRLEILRVARSIGWLGEERALAVQREIVLDVLQPPIYGEGRDLVCGMDPAIVKRLDIRADEVPLKTYRDEFGIQTLACLKPEDERIHLALSQSLGDRREWIARLAANALKEMRPGQIAVQIALADQLKRRDAAARASAAEALRELKPSNPQVLDAIRKNDPAFSIDWLAPSP